MRVTKPIVLGVATVFGLGLTTAFAADNHGAAVSLLAHQSKPLLSGSAFGEAISDFAMTNGKAGAKLATTKAADRLNHGEAVSAVATSEATAAHATGANKVNHGGAVSAAAQKR
jgi:hypothetical protein